MKNVYFIAGLGADKRSFSFLDLSFCKPVFIEWIEPLKNESLKSYALRLRKQIPEEHPVVVGVSFGGMLAAEMAKEDEQMSVIIIASNKSSDEFPYYLRVGKYVPLYKWLPEKLMKNAGLVNRVIGLKQEAQKKLLAQILADMDTSFLKWAIGAILNWKEKNNSGNIKHIHGTADKLLPFRYVKADHHIDGGTHLISLNNASEISTILKEMIQD